MDDEKLDRGGRSELHNAVIDQRTERVAELLAAGANVNRADKNGWTPLHFAAQGQAVDVAKMLMDAGANPNAQDVHGNTPLFKAVFGSRGEGRLIQLLRENGADPFVSNKHGVSPISLARQIANYDVAKWFDDLGKAVGR